MHNDSVHKPKRERDEFKAPEFRYTGNLRPFYVTPMRSVPEHIPRPDYFKTGIPKSEMDVRKAATIPILKAEQIEILREACKIGRKVLDSAGKMVNPGVTTEEIDEMVHNLTVECGAYPSPLNYRGFPKACCTSVNEVICHGIPDVRPLEDGDIVNIDISVYYKGFHADLNETYLVGNVDQDSKKLVKSSYDSLMKAIEYAKPGVLFREFGGIITNVVKQHGFSVVKSYCGHGIGELFHCAPNIPHYAKNKAVGTMKPGMAFTIEPMINAGVWNDETWPDDWTAVTIDGKRSAQFEHTLLATESGVEILTARTADSVPFWWETEGL
jgi:methionyl aminopeptidase